MAVRIGELLLKEKRITPEQLQEALNYQRQNGGKLGYNLIKLGYVKDEEITALLSKQYGVPSIALTRANPVEAGARADPDALARQQLLGADGHHTPIARSRLIRPHVRINRKDQRRATSLRSIDRRANPCLPRQHKCTVAELGLADVPHDDADAHRARRADHAGVEIEPAVGMAAIQRFAAVEQFIRRMRRVVNGGTRRPAHVFQCDSCVYPRQNRLNDRKA